MVGVTEEEVPRARQCCSDACVLGYVSMSDEVNIVWSTTVCATGKILVIHEMTKFI